MANYPKKLMDPTEAALSAIQEALNVRDDEERQAPPPDESELPLAHSADAMVQTEPATPAFDEAIDLDDIDTRDHRTAEPQPFRAAGKQCLTRTVHCLATSGKAADLGDLPHYWPQACPNVGTRMPSPIGAGRKLRAW